MAWVEREVDQECVNALYESVGDRLLARLLALRGVTPETLQEFLTPSIKLFMQPKELPGVLDAAAVLLDACKLKRKVVVCGDYDCDGICATAILVKALEALGCDVAYFLPNRLTEGYGLNFKSIERLLSIFPDVGLVVTVDNGINSIEEVEYLKAKGVDVIITDHHLPGDELPKCIIVNPKVSAPKPLSGLSGAGVAYLLANALVLTARELGIYNGAAIAGPLIVLAGLATVSDIMPLKDQNRILVAESLKLFARHAPIGLKELHARGARTGTATMTVRDYGFIIGPRINASGRISDGMEALKLILSEDCEESREFARLVDNCNVDRKNVEKQMTDEAFKQVIQGASAQLIWLHNGHSGVAGIVAARVMDRLESECKSKSVPVAVIVGRRGSLRSPNGYNVRDALAKVSQYLEHFGGHAAAGGFTIKEGMHEDFSKAFLKACEAQYSSNALDTETTLIDALVEPSDLTEEVVERLSSLEPFGEENPEPIFAFKGVCLKDVKLLGKDGAHLQFAFRSCPSLRAVWWNHGGDVELLRSNSLCKYDIMFNASISTYGTTHVELKVLSLRKV